MASTYLSRTFGTATSRKKFTLSMWVKLSGRGTGNNNSLLVSGASGQNEGTIKISSDAILWNEYNVGIGGSEGLLISNQLLRDYSAWYHLVFAWDSTNATADDRMKIYLGGEQVTSFSSRTNPSLNYDAQINNNIVHNIGRQTWNSSGFFDGSMSHIHFIDGTAYDASAFGSTDSTTGEWKINTSPSVTYGTNGFFILKDGNSVTDQSGNSNNFTVAGGTLTKTEDCPSNVFATWNPLANANTSSTALTNGNTTFATPSGGHDFTISTLGMNSGSGKFYCETKVSVSSSFNMIGISDHMYQGGNQELSEDNYSYGYYSDSGGGSTAAKVRGNGSYILSGMPNYTTNDIIGMAIDLENHKLYFSKNGTWINSGDPTSGSTGTGAVSIQDLRTVTSTYGNGVYFFGAGDWHTSSGGTYQCNFGNGYFGTTAVASAGTNASGIGIFEYDVPTGYTALSTKGLNL